MKKTWPIFTLCLLLIALGGAYWRWGDRLNQNSEAADYEKAKALLTMGEPREAAVIIDKYKGTFTSEPPKRGIDWLPLAAEAMIKANDATDLSRLWENYPRMVGDNEAMALAISGGLIASRQLGKFGALRKEWQAKHHNETAWFALDADALISQGKRKEAIQLLESRSFEGPDDSLRLVRLAILKASENLQTSWQLLETALIKDPKNSTILSYRGQIMEMLKQPGLARHEYNRAIQTNPKNVFLYDQLAQFYNRWGQFHEALRTWEKALAIPNNAFIWLRVLFWSRVATPIQIDWKQLPPPKGILKPLIDYLLALPNGVFWDEKAFEKLPNSQNYLKSYQEIFWLRLTDTLMRKQEDQAMDMLTHNLYAHQSWAPDLTRALQQILSYRRYGVLNIDSPPLNASESPRFQHSFFSQLEELAQESAEGVPAQNVPREMDALLSGPYAFPAAYLASGWFQAALSFGQPSTLPNNLPPWVAYAYAQAIRMIQGPLEAMKFITLQKVTPLTQLLLGELMLQTESLDAGLDQLKDLAKEDSDVGFRAAWLSALALAEKHQFMEAKAVVADNPRLRDTVAGKEILGKIALAENNQTQADQIYSSILEDSAEAQWYLAQRAYRESNFERAQALLEQLMIRFPDNQTLANELDKVKKQRVKGQ